MSQTKIPHITTIFIYAMLIIAVTVVFNISPSDTENSSEEVKQDTIESVDLIFKDSVALFIKQMNMQHPDIVLAQAIVESGNFKSNIFIENNNLFGMKEPLSRNTVALGTKNGHAYYKNWQHSVIDYALYQSSYFFNNKRDYGRNDYLERLSRSYAQDPNYINKIKKVLLTIE